MFCIIMIWNPSFLYVGKLVESTRERERKRERDRIMTQWKEMMGNGEWFHPSESVREQPWLYAIGRRKLSKWWFYGFRVCREDVTVTSLNCEREGKKILPQNGNDCHRTCSVFLRPLRISAAAMCRAACRLYQSAAMETW